MNEEYFQRPLELFEEKLDNWSKLPVPWTFKENSLEEIVSKLRSLTELSIGDHLIVDLHAPNFDGFDALAQEENGFIRLIRQYDTKHYIRLRPKEMHLHLDLERRKNYVLLLAGKGELLVNDLMFPDYEKCLEQNGKFYSLAEFNRLGQFCNSVINIYRENIPVLIHPKGSVYAFDWIEKDRILKSRKSIF